VSTGDELPILVKWETIDTIRQFRSLLHEGGEEGKGQPDPGEFDTVPMAAEALFAYITELLEKGFRIESIMAKDSNLTLRTFAPVKPEDTISLSGVVTGKDLEGEGNGVECLITIENQDNVVVAEATARITL
jgi:hypothetical protein